MTELAGVNSNNNETRQEKEEGNILELESVARTGPKLSSVGRLNDRVGTLIVTSIKNESDINDCQRMMGKESKKANQISENNGDVSRERSEVDRCWDRSRMDVMNMGLTSDENPIEELEIVHGTGKEVGCDLDGKNISKEEGNPIPIQKSVKEKEAKRDENWEPDLKIEEELLQVIQNRKKNKIFNKKYDLCVKFRIAHCRQRKGRREIGH